jgi:hypothetical protein
MASNAGNDEIILLFSAREYNWPQSRPSLKFLDFATPLAMTSGFWKLQDKRQRVRLSQFEELA